MEHPENIYQGIERHKVDAVLRPMPENIYQDIERYAL